MKILVVNDDGIKSKGLYTLYKSLSFIAQVTVVAPEKERSATAHAITLEHPIRVRDYYFEDGFKAYAVSGTPADCTKIAINTILDEKPDLVVSGINQGANLGISVIYSGTVSAATEGCILGIPSFAVSLTSFEDQDFSYAGSFAKKVAQLVYQDGLPDGVLLNINIPSVPQDQIKGVKITNQSRTRFMEYFDKRIDPQERVYYWLSGELVKMSDDESLDSYATDKNYVSITPLQVDRTAKEYIQHLKKLENI